MSLIDPLRTFTRRPFIPQNSLSPPKSRCDEKAFPNSTPHCNDRQTVCPPRAPAFHANTSAMRVVMGSRWISQLVLPRSTTGPGAKPDGRKTRYDSHVASTYRQISERLASSCGAFAQSRCQLWVAVDGQCAIKTFTRDPGVASHLGHAAWTRDATQRSSHQIRVAVFQRRFVVCRSDQVRFCYCRQ